MKNGNIKFKGKRMLASVLSLALVITALSTSQISAQAKEQQPQAQDEQNNIVTPDVTRTPEITEAPAPTATPEVTKVPEATDVPDTTPAVTTPTVTEPEATATPAMPEVTVTPEITGTVSDNTVSENTVTPDAEQKEVRLEKQVGNILIVATAQSGILPENAVLEAEEITTTGTMEQTIENTITDSKQVDEIRSFDISITSDGEKVDLKDNTVSITFEGIEVAADQDAEVVYTTDDGKQAEKRDTQVNEDKVGFEAEHFSVYNVVIVSEPKDGTKIPVYIPSVGFATISMAGLNQPSVTVTTGTEFADAYIGDDNSLKLVAKGKEGTAEINVTDADGKKVTYMVSVAGQPSYNAADFHDQFTTLRGMDAIVTDIPTKQTLQEAIDYQFSHSHESCIDSTSTNGIRTAACKEAFNQANIACDNISYCYAKKTIEGTDTRFFYYAPIDLAAYPDDAKIALAGGLEQLVQVTVFNENDMTTETCMVPLVLKNYTNEENVKASYVVLDLGLSEKAKTADYTLTYTVDSAYQKNYSLTGAGINATDTKTIDITTDKKLSAFTIGIQNKAGKVVDRVVMTLDNDVVGYKDDGTKCEFSKGTVISTIANGKAVVKDTDTAAGFSNVNFAPSTTVSILIKPIVSTPTPTPTPTPEPTTTPDEDVTPVVTPTVAPVIPVIPVVNPVIPVQPVPLAAVPVANNNVQDAVAIEDNDTPLAEAPKTEAENKEQKTIEEEPVAQAPTYDSHCFIHWIILILTLIYAGYAVVRAVLRQKKIKELENNSDEVKA